MVNEILQRCPGCMQPLTGAPQCPVCGTPAIFEQGAPFLPLRTQLLLGRIGVGCAVEQNGDGITYLAFDAQAGRPVHLREFFPAAIAMRAPGQLAQLVMHGCEAVWQDCAQNFLELWRKLQRLRGLSALLAVTEVFEENGTVYAVYEHMESMTYRDFLLRGKLGYISWDRARSLLMPVLSTLAHLHQQGILHRGISPGTLFFCADGKVRLAGFSIWQARTARGDLTAELTEGYAALEQYSMEDRQGPWTDIYAFAAVLFRSLIGSDPDGAVARRHNDRLMIPAQFAERIPPYVVNALINAMGVFPEERTRTIEQLRAELSASPTAIVQSAAYPPASPIPGAPPIPPPKEEDIPPAKRQSAGAVAMRTMLIIIAVGIVGIAVVLGVFFRDEVRGFVMGLGGARPPATAATTVETIQVPMLEGRVYDDTLLLEFEDKLTFRVVEQYDDVVPAGRIIRQDVPAGRGVPVNGTVVLTVSIGRPTVELPNVEGRPYDEVRDELEDLGFKVTIRGRGNSDEDKAGTVISVANLTPGQSYPKGTQVFLSVWGNPDGTPLEGEEVTGEEETEEGAGA